MTENKESRPVGRAIITFARGWQTLAATRSLGKRGVEVITGDEYRMTPSSFSRYSIDDFRYPSPTNEPEKFLDVLEETILKHKPDPGVPYVLLTIHKEGYLVARHRERFEPHIRMVLPEIEQIEAVHNKGTLAARAIAEGIPAPPTWLPGSIEEFDELKNVITLPAFVKLRESAAGVGIQKVDTVEELDSTFRKFVAEFGVKPGDLPIIQAAVPGDDYCVTTLFDHGKLITCMTYRNLRAYPAEKGAGVLRETVDAPRMEEIAEGLLGPLGWHGVAEIDFRWDGTPDGEPYLIEINPRFWGGLTQAIESGWDYPWLLYRLAVDGRVDPPDESRYDVRTETPILGLLATLQDIANTDAEMERMRESWNRAKTEFKEGSKRAGLRALFSGMKDALDVRDRAAEAKRLLNEHKGSIYDVLSSEDPMAAMGVLFPLAVFLKHGKVNMELLTSEGGPARDDEE